jgi:hypothetical protein
MRKPFLHAAEPAERECFRGGTQRAALVALPPRAATFLGEGSVASFCKSFIQHLLDSLQFC